MGKEADLTQVDALLTYNIMLCKYIWSRTLITWRVSACTYPRSSFTLTAGPSCIRRPERSNHRTAPRRAVICFAEFQQFQRTPFAKMNFTIATASMIYILSADSLGIEPMHHIAHSSLFSAVEFDIHLNTFSTCVSKLRSDYEKMEGSLTREESMRKLRAYWLVNCSLRLVEGKEEELLPRFHLPDIRDVVNQRREVVYGVYVRSCSFE
ncbi:AaceriAFR580Cp [Echinococcus multilocularis]|uniref:AaceriAFR580Cp n=1 Tax=Echinococcus multilocularis TaxID=6211 RepID=A0A0S4MKF9_ECHMU|nr:AaceriAFR580Cp [Echinococcus multilocularis]CUT98672.1 AaceriAFR580Cp [Echinococcus multilocularis]